jgi:hypothetical protein
MYPYYARAWGLLEFVVKEANRQGLEWFKLDTDLDGIRKDPRFTKMMADAETRLTIEGVAR